MRRLRQFAILICVIVLGNVASAQAYSIRVQFNTNLRAEASLDSQVVQSAPAGSILQVVGSFGRWLNISRDGSSLWMADWVSYSRVDGSAPVPSQPANVSPANVDNCCFVDRQCHSEADWTDGFYAYQNGQCAAPVSSQPQPAPQTPAQPASNIPAGVDNCCQVDRECHSEWDWEQGFYAYLAGQCRVAGAVRNVAWSSYMTEPVYRLLQNPSHDPFNNCCYMHHGTCHNDDDWKRGAQDYRNHQCIHPAPLGTRPVIVGNNSPLGTEKFTKLANTALELMRIHTPEWLRYIDLSGARELKLLSADQGGGFLNQEWSIVHSYYSWQQEDPNWEPDYDYIVGYAGGITHEACHAIQQRTYSQSAGWTNEAACVEAQLAVIEAINPNSRDVGWLRDSVASFSNP